MKKHCEHCGACVESYKHRLSKGLVSSLYNFALKVKASGKNTQHLTDVGLNNNQFTNFQKLKYFGLVEKSEKAGEWTITRKGRLFIAGEVAVENFAVTFRNVVEESSRDLVFVKDVLKDKTSDYWQKEFGVEFTTDSLF